MNAVSAIGSTVQIIFGICTRDMKRLHRDSPFGVLSAMVEPMATILIMTIAFSAIRMRAPGMGDYLMVFLMTGVAPLFMFRRACMVAERLHVSMRQVLWFPNVNPIHLLLAGLLEAFVTMTTLTLIITLFFKLVYQIPEPQNLLMALVPLVCNGFIAFGFAALNLVIRSWFGFWQTIFATLFAPIGILSGMFFTAQMLPDRVLAILYWNPFFHSTDYMRHWYFHEYNSTFFDPYYYFGWALGGLAVGLVLERYCRRRILLVQP